MTESPTGVALVLLAALGSFGGAGLSLLAVFAAVGAGERRAMASGVAAVACGILATLLLTGASARVVPWPVVIAFELLVAGLCAWSAGSVSRAVDGGRPGSRGPAAAFAAGAASALLSVAAVVAFLVHGG